MIKIQLETKKVPKNGPKIGPNWVKLMSTGRTVGGGRELAKKPLGGPKKTFPTGKKKIASAEIFSGGHPEGLQNFAKNLVSRTRPFFATYSYSAFHP